MLLGIPLLLFPPAAKPRCIESPPRVCPRPVGAVCVAGERCGVAGARRPPGMVICIAQVTRNSEVTSLLIVMVTVVDGDGDYDDDGNDKNVNNEGEN